MTQQLRMDLIGEYYSLYRRRNLSRGHVKQFREKYIELSELWLELTDNERTAINIRFTQDNLGAR